MQLDINSLIIKAKDEDFITQFSAQDVINARTIITGNIHSAEDLFLFLAAINLLNAAIKRQEYKDLLSYASIKGNVSRLINHLLNIGKKRYGIDFYINEEEKCAYVEIRGLQFSFHNININDKVQSFINSDKNIVKPWREIRLQRIGGELFRLVLEYHSSS